MTPSCRIMWPLFSLLLTGWMPVASAQNTRSEPTSPEKHLTYVEAATDEPSCGGTWLGIHLDGNRIQKLDYSIETSQKLIEDAYYFEDAQPVVVVERIYRLLDKDGNHVEHPKLESNHRYILAEEKTPKTSQLMDHVDYLIRYFHEHVEEFKPKATDD